MTYFDKTRVKQDLNLSSVQYDSQIDGVWGPAADHRIDTKLTGYISVPLTSIPDDIREAANEYVKYRYYKSIHQEVAKDSALKEFNDMMSDYILGLRQSTNQFIVSQGYRTYPLNPNATPYRSISGGNNALDDSDL
jgi:hypothetical protein